MGPRLCNVGLIVLPLLCAVLVARTCTAAQSDGHDDSSGTQLVARLLCSDSRPRFCKGHATGTTCIRNHTVGLDICKATCRRCTELALQIEEDTQFSITVVHSRVEVACKDRAHNCAALHGQGACNTQLYRMLRSCPATCGFCRTPGGPADTRQRCRDVLDACPYWATIGLCDAALQWVGSLCRASCGRCPPPAVLRPLASLTAPATGKECVDYNPHCPRLADEEHCMTSFDYMRRYCQATCDFCNLPDTPATRNPHMHTDFTGGHRTTNPYTLPTAGATAGSNSDIGVTSAGGMADTGAGAVGRVIVLLPRQTHADSSTRQQAGYPSADVPGDGGGAGIQYDAGDGRQDDVVGPGRQDDDVGSGRQDDVGPGRQDVVGPGRQDNDVGAGRQDDVGSGRQDDVVGSGRQDADGSGRQDVDGSGRQYVGGTGELVADPSADRAYSGGTPGGSQNHHLSRARSWGSRAAGKGAAAGSPRWAVPPTGPACEDKDARCEAWAAARGCEMSRGVRETTCRLACGGCDPYSMEFQQLRSACEDQNEFCESWAKGGHCESNAAYMLRSCGAACGVCEVAWSQYVRPAVRLSTGALMPVMGFGTAGLGAATETAVVAALRAGYRLFDSAQAREWYREDLVGRALQSAPVPREELFLTSKLHPRHLGYSATMAQVPESLRDLGTSYLDLFLLHYPLCWGTLCSPQPGGTWQSSWRALEMLHGRGDLRAIGVSNFNLEQMQALVAMAKVKPAVLQVNSDPRRPAFELQAFCRKHGILFQAYSSLGTQWDAAGPNPVLTGGPVLAAAQRYNASTVQVVLRWALQHGQLVIPRSQNVSHMEENMAALYDLQLDRQTMLDIDGMEVHAEDA